MFVMSIYLRAKEEFATCEKICTDLFFVNLLKNIIPFLFLSIGKVYTSMKVPDICLQYEHMYVLDVPKVSQTASSLI